jgi:hypothetical protein
MQRTNVNATGIRQQVSLVDLLAALGYQPAKPAGRELIYNSMLRETDPGPTFFVNRELNIWYDSGMAKGGSVIDFAMAYWKLTFTEAVKKITVVSGNQLLPVPYMEKRARKHARKLPWYCIEEIKSLGNNPAITEYITGCGIWPVAQANLREVYYFVEDEQKNRKQFFASGWQNELGDWEVRNQYFKGSLGHRGITFISRDDCRLAVFDNYFDYLSWLTENPVAPESILVLNALDLLQSAIRKAKDFLEISLFFNRDYIGRLACAEFIQAMPHAADRSAHYKDFNGYNEMLVTRIKKKRTISRSI